MAFRCVGHKGSVGEGVFPGDLDEGLRLFVEIGRLELPGVLRGLLGERDGCAAFVDAGDDVVELVRIDAPGTGCSFFCCGN